VDQRKIAYRWGLIGALVLLLVGGAGAWQEFARDQPSRQPAIPADAVVVSLANAAGGAPITLGMGSDIPDDLDARHFPGTTIVPALRAAQVGLVRFGADSADGYDWETGCSYRNDGRFPECGNGAGGGSSFDHFLQFANAVGAQPLIVVNGAIDDPQQAARMVAYYWQHCVRVGGPPGRQPGACVDPYWEIGYSPATWTHFAIPLTNRRIGDKATIQPDQYAAEVISYAAAMQRTTPSHTQLLIVADEWITGATDQSWVALAHVAAIDTHYSALLYVPGSPQPSSSQITGAVEGDAATGRPGIDTRLEDLRSSLAQFSNSDGIGVIVGQWSIDAYNHQDEPGIYGGYVQAVFAAELLAHLWQDADPGGPNPLIGAIQYPIIGSSQEPFDPVSGQPRAALAVYRLVDRYLGAAPVSAMIGAALAQRGLVAAAAMVRPGVTGVLLVNTDAEHAVTLRLEGVAADGHHMWWVTPDTHGGAGVSPLHQAMTRGDQITLPPWAIAVVQAPSA
jgi:hypothetical protein